MASAGYTGMKRFVMISEINVLVFRTDEYDSKFSNLWNNLCAGKHT